ncbi:42745_t:CDS:2, partial [Gigaspora margarita]
NTIDNNIEYNILAHNESITGWIEVIEEIKPRNIHVLYARHFLLEGIFRETQDSIYRCFYLMEGPKLNHLLMHTSLQAHNVDLDIVELDPVVYDLAANYFDLKHKHKIYLQDEYKFINNTDAQIYNYVLYDVFFGGSVLSTLFSIKAFEQIKSKYFLYNISTANKASSSWTCSLIQGHNLLDFQIEYLPLLVLLQMI